MQYPSLENILQKIATTAPLFLADPAVFFACLKQRLLRRFGDIESRLLFPSLYAQPARFAIPPMRDACTSVNALSSAQSLPCRIPPTLCPTGATPALSCGKLADMQTLDHPHAPELSPRLNIARSCPNCTRPFTQVSVTGHYQKKVELDVCEACNFIWFDDLESVQLSGAGVLDLLNVMAGAQTTPLQPLKNSLECVQCRAPLKRAANIVLHGRSMHLECADRHGTLQSFALFLSERGLVRPLLPIDLPGDGSTEPLECLNCGAPVRYGEHQECGHCQSPLFTLDVDRVAHMIAQQRHERLRAAAEAPPEIIDSQCGNCGAAVDKATRMQCTHCGGVMATTHLRKAVKTLQERLRQLKGRDEPFEFSAEALLPTDREAETWRSLGGRQTNWSGIKRLGEKLSRRRDTRERRFEAQTQVPNMLMDYVNERPLLRFWGRVIAWLGVMFLFLTLFRSR